MPLAAMEYSVLSSVTRSIFRPIIFISMNMLALPPALLLSLLRLDLSLEGIRHRWFALFWKVAGPMSSAGAAPQVSAILPAAQGVVLDIGTGAGHFLKFYDASRVSRLICVEPNAEHHAALEWRARDAGFEVGRNFEIVSQYVQDLGRTVPGVDEGTVDTVVTLQVLCSVPGPRDVARELYRLLRSGGSWILYEHVRAHSRFQPINLAQRLYNVAWPAMFGDCNLCRDTRETLTGVGTWNDKKSNVEFIGTDLDLLPHVAGIMVKE